MRAWMVALTLTLVGCGGGTRHAMPADGGGPIDGSGTMTVHGKIDAACWNTEQCLPNGECENGHCTVVCPDLDAGMPCNVGGVSDFPPECCMNGDHCCGVSFETEGCVAATESCPVSCGQAFNTLCFPEHVCVYSFSPTNLPPDGGCAWVDVADCAPTCDTGRLCGSNGCCGAYARCVGGCCVGSATP